MGRIDDVLNVAGHRLGTMEIESALVSHPRVAEAAVVGRPHEIKGESVFAYVVCRGQRPAGDTSGLVKELRDWVGEQLGAIAKPDDIRFADNLPKTRSGKIMRRLLRSVARGEEISQDVSTLENPAILDQLRGVEGPPAAGKAEAATRKPVAAKKPSSRGKPPKADKEAPSKRTAAGAKAGTRKKAGADARTAGQRTAGHKKAVARTPAAKKPVAAKRAAATKRAGAGVRARPAAKAKLASGKTGRTKPASRKSAGGRSPGRPAKRAAARSASAGVRRSKG
jgi:hypothetical protein